MAKQLHLHSSEPDSLKDTPSCEELLQQALAEREQFLAEHPRHIDYQRDIDRIISKAGTSENRLAVVSVMMEGKLNELNHQFRSLIGILNTAFTQGYSNPI